MEPDQFRECLASLRWSQRGLADILDINPTTIRRMASGQMPIPDNVSDWLIKASEYLSKHPLPINW